jgi:hypothetical protein
LEATELEEQPTGRAQAVVTRGLRLTVAQDRVLGRLMELTSSKKITHVIKIALAGLAKQYDVNWPTDDTE